MRAANMNSWPNSDYRWLIRAIKKSFRIRLSVRWVSALKTGLSICGQCHLQTSVPPDLCDSIVVLSICGRAHMTFSVGRQIYNLWRPLIRQKSFVLFIRTPTLPHRLKLERCVRTFTTFTKLSLVLAIVLSSEIIWLNYRFYLVWHRVHFIWHLRHSFSHSHAVSLRSTVHILLTANEWMSSRTSRTAIKSVRRIINK